MKPWLNFSVRFAAAFVAALALAPLFALLLPATAFHRVCTRTFQIALVIALAVKRGPVSEWPEKLRAMGFRGPHRFRRVMLGVAVGVGLTALMLVLSWAVGGRAAEHSHRMDLAQHVLKAALAGIFVSFFEELFVRGYLKDAIGGIASAILFAAAHFVQPMRSTAPAGKGYDPLLAVKRLPELVQAWGDLQNATLGFLSLLVFALTLNRLRERTGTLYLGMGLHGGFVFVLALYRRFLEGDPSGSRWIYGGTRMHDGLLPFLALLLLLVASYRAPLPPWARA